MTMVDDDKPDLEDYILEHYGVMGMKWGVRRSQAQLDRAAGRKTARAEKKANKNPSRSKTVREARKDVMGKRRQEIKSQDFRGKASIFLAGEFSNRLSLEYRANPNRAVAFQQTTGEKVATTLLAIPSVGASAVVALGNQSMNRSITNDQQLAALILSQKKQK